jgi:hypothetical protein
MKVATHATCHLVNVINGQVESRVAKWKLGVAVGILDASDFRTRAVRTQLEGDCGGNYFLY